jgi:hypothetical protein
LPFPGVASPDDGPLSEQEHVSGDQDYLSEHSRLRETAFKPVYLTDYWSVTVLSRESLGNGS